MEIPSALKNVMQNGAGEMSPEQMIEGIKFISGLRQFIPKLLDLSNSLVKPWEQKPEHELTEGEYVQYSGYVRDRDAIIYVCAVKQIQVEGLPEGCQAMQSRVLHRYVITELIDKLDQYIPKIPQ